jgi:Uma2 family endonuclease
MQPMLEMRDTWTFDDLQTLPEDVDWRRYEIVDGSLVVSPSTSRVHEVVSDSVRSVIRAALPPSTRVIGPIGVDLGHSYRIPDLVVVPNRVFAVNAPLLDPSDVQLAVEVVSPGSVTTDRVTKPAQYAAAGIPAYWRVETDPEVSVAAYVLEGAVYRELGTWRAGEIARITTPFAVEITVSELAPPADEESAAT